MSFDPDSPELLRTFLAETDELLDSLAFDCGRSTRPQAELTGRVRRAVHTIKGNAAMLGLDELVVASHRVEQRLADEADVLDALDAIGPQLDRLRAQVGGAPEPQRETETDPLERQMVRVDHDRLVELETLVAEVSAATRLIYAALSRDALCREPDPLLNTAAQTLSHRVSELNRAVARARLQPFGSLIGRASRLVRELAISTGRPAALAPTGASLEVDRAVLEALHPVLVQLIRNTFAHGLEPIGNRLAAGKPRAGRITIDAASNDSDLVLTYADDGRGLDLDTLRARGGADADPGRLILEPGFTTTESPGALAGRGVGMDIVRVQVERLGGRIEIENAPGLGLTLRLVLPHATSG